MTEKEEDYSGALRERLESLLGKYSQSDIARKTGTSVANVSRYLKGRRVPADFCCALIDKLELNPAWFMLGEGATSVSDISAEAAKTADDMIELVQAMNSITQKSLGTLFKKEHYTSLRQLDDALGVYEKARAGLRERLKPIHRKLLRDFNSALEAREMDRAGTVRAAISQVSRFSDEPELAEEAQELEIIFQLYSGNIDLSLELERARFIRKLLTSKSLTVDVLRTCWDLLVSLYYSNIVVEGLRLGKAVLAFFEDRTTALDLEEEGKKCFAAIQALIGVLETDRGELAIATARIQQYAPKCVRTEFRPYARTALMRSGYLSGALDFQSLASLGPHSVLSQSELIRVACWMEDKENIRFALQAYVDKLSSKKLMQVLPESLEMVLGKSRAEALKYYERHVHERANTIHFASATREPLAFILSVGHAQLLRLAGKIDEARLRAAEAAKLLAAVPPEYTVDIFWRAIHSKNVIELCKGSKNQAFKALRPASEEFFRSHVAKGYLCFEEYCSTLAERP